MKKAKHLVVDAGALIKNTRVFELAENVYTLPEIINEIRDKQTRERLRALPYEFKFREPPPEIIKIVTEFSKKTGDYPSLSANDIRVIALTYLLEKEFVGTNHIKSEPSPLISSTKAPSDLYKPLAGFYTPKASPQTVGNLKDEKNLENSQDSGEQKLDDYKKSINQNQEVKRQTPGDFIAEEERSDSSIQRTNLDNESNEDDGRTDVLSREELDEREGDRQSNDDDDEADDDQDDEGWITPENIKEARKQMEALSLEDTSFLVGCVTTDFAMQNVLMQMGLHVVSVEGMLIKQCRTFILRCFACFSTTTNMTKQFCPSCGNKTLRRVAFSVGEDGSRILHLNFRRPINIRGTRHPLPLPKGGKHAVNPILCEDQRIPQNRPPKSALQKVNALDPDYEARGSPFAINDVYSRAANLGIRVNRRQHNPNERSKKTRK